MKLKIGSLLILALFAFTGIVLLAADSPFKLEPGFTSLFNGRDLDGWGYRAGSGPVTNLGTATQSSDGRFTAHDGLITDNPFDAAKSPTRIRMLWTTRTFSNNFHLILEFRANTNADSGLFLRSQATQLQVRDYYVAGPDAYKKLKNYKPQDWNVIDVTVTSNIARCLCNGEVLEEAFKLPANGPIGLEADRGQMDYRNIRIMELP